MVFLSLAFHSTYTGVLILEFMQHCKLSDLLMVWHGYDKRCGHIKMLTDGTKVGVLVVLAADTSFNKPSINLVDLAQTGIEYLPVV